MFEKLLDALSEAPRIVFWTVSFGMVWVVMSAAAFLTAILIAAMMSALAMGSMTASPLLVAGVAGFLLTGIVHLLVSWEVPPRP